jgi:hypothetical protein
MYPESHIAAIQLYITVSLDLILLNTELSWNGTRSMWEIINRICIKQTLGCLPAPDFGCCKPR